MFTPQGPEGQKNNQQPSNRFRNLALAEIGATTIGTTMAINSLKNNKGEPVNFSYQGVKDWRITLPVSEIFNDPSIVVKDPAILVSPVGLEINREQATTNTVNATVLHPYNSSSKEGSESLATDTQNAINKLLAQKPVTASSYGSATLLKDSLRNTKSRQALTIDSVQIKTTSSGERIENGPKSLITKDAKNVDLATQRADLVGGVVRESIPVGTKINEISGELEFTQDQITRLAEIGKNSKITGKNDLEVAYEVLKQVNSGNLKNQEVVGMVGNMRKTEISVTTTGKIDNIEHIGIPALIPVGILGLTLATRWAFRNIRLPEISIPTLSCPKPNFRLSCFPCELPKLPVCAVPPCVKGVGCCEWPKFDCPKKEKFDLFEPEEVKYDRFMPNHINQAVINDGFDLSHIIDSYIVQTTTLQNRIRSRNYPIVEMEVEYTEVVTNIANLLERRYKAYSHRKQLRLDNTDYEDQSVTDFRGHSYVERAKLEQSNRLYMEDQAKMLAQMIIRGSNQYRISTPCFVGARIKAAIRVDQMNRF